MLTGCNAAVNQKLCDMPSVDLCLDCTAHTGKFPEDASKPGGELELRNMLNFDAFELMEELPAGKHAFDMVWVDEWRGDRVRRSRLLHPRTDEEIYVKVPSDICSKFWRLKAAVNGTRKASKHSCDKLVQSMLFQQNDIYPCIHKRFFDNLDLEQHGDDFLVCGSSSDLEHLADEFKKHFLVCWMHWE